MDALRTDYRRQDLLRDPRKCPTCQRPYEWAEPHSFPWFEVVIVLSAAVIITAGLMKWEFDQNIYRWENIKVTKKIDSWRYKMKFPSGEYTVFFCRNGYKPCIPEGAVLTSLRYEDTGDCWDIKPAGLGYNLLQDEQGNSIDEHGKVVFNAETDSCQ